MAPNQKDIKKSNHYKNGRQLKYCNKLFVMLRIIIHECPYKEGMRVRDCGDISSIKHMQEEALW